MTEIEENEVRSAVRALQARMLRHSFDHLPETIDLRTGMIVVKNELLASTPESQIPEHTMRIIENPEHGDRGRHTYGPLILYRDEDGSRTSVELTVPLLNPDLRMRLAALNEIDRQTAFHAEIGCPFLSPNTRRRIDELRGTVSSEDLRDSLDASVEVNDLLEDDYFYLLAGIRQSSKLLLHDMLGDLFNRALSPSESSLHFLLSLPIWSPARQKHDIDQTLNRLALSANSLTNVLTEYFRRFGHLPLAGESSIAGAVALWANKHTLPSNTCDVVWAWANENGGPLARYHACQLLFSNPDWVPPDRRRMLLREAAEIISGPANDQRWKLRCDLARHYCRHLEMLEPGGDGERIAAFSWWLAEYLGEIVDGMPSKARDGCLLALKGKLGASEELWSVARPPISGSSLRCATLFSASIWATSILCEFSGSGGVSLLNEEDEWHPAFKKALSELDYNSLSAAGLETRYFAFEGSTAELAARLTNNCSDGSDQPIGDIQSLSAAARLGGGMEKLIVELPTINAFAAKVVTYELRSQAMSGMAPSEAMFKSFSDEKWRNSVLRKFDEETLQLVRCAAVEVATHDRERDWRTYLPHFFAAACEATPPEQEERKRVLFTQTAFASLAMNSVSAVERLLEGHGRRAFKEPVENWRSHIEQLAPHAPPWVAGKLRSLKAVLHLP